ncbi:MAG: hypothetical protein AAGF55_12415 [Pseudomonadota bacterium]
MSILAGITARVFGGLVAGHRFAPPCGRREGTIFLRKIMASGGRIFEEMKGVADLRHHD